MVVASSASKLLQDCSAEEARKHFLKGASYFNSDLPSYLSFEPVLNGVEKVLGGKSYKDFQSSKPSKFEHVNYKLLNNKDGRFAWRQYEIIHPAIYVSLVNLICDPENWSLICARLASFQSGVVTCCSSPVVSLTHQTDKAEQISNWWQRLEQETLRKSLEYSHILHTDVTDCYGSLYTHSIPWALHGKEVAKQKDKDSKLGADIDFHMQAGRYGQTNGIPQGSVLMDFVAELVLGYVDQVVTEKLVGSSVDYCILRYRDDYRILAPSDSRAEEILKVVSDALRTVGMRLGASKTSLSSNVVESAIKPDKLAGIGYYDNGGLDAETLQKKLLHLHAFGRRFPNSGALKRLLSKLQDELIEQKVTPSDLDVQIAIATDIALTSPSCIPVVASILSHLISLKEDAEKAPAWNAVLGKMKKIPYNGYLELWLQRVTKPSSVGLDFQSEEALCKIVNGETHDIWDNGWIDSKDLLQALNTASLVVSEPEKMPEAMAAEETKLFKENAFHY